MIYINYYSVFEHGKNLLYFLTLTDLGSNPARDFHFFHMKEAIQLAYGKSVVLFRCPFVS